MNDIFIINIIEEYRRRFKNGDGGREFVLQLSKKLLNTVDEDKRQVIVFFLNEIRCNKNGYREVAIAVIVNMNAKEIAPDIERIYNDIASKMDDEWKLSIINSLMILEYVYPRKMYFEFTSSYFNKYPYNSFSLLLNYLKVDLENALSMLSDYFVLCYSNNKRNSTVEVGFLFHSFPESSVENLCNLVKKVVFKDKEAGIILKELIVSYLNSDMATQYPLSMRTEIQWKIDGI